MSFRSSFFGSLPLAFFLLTLGFGQGEGAERLTLLTHPSGALFELKGPTTIRGSSPLPLSAEQQGRYRVRVELSGYETTHGSLALRHQDGSLRLAEASDFRRERILRSLVLPGTGQIREGRSMEGALWTLTTFGASVAALTLEAKYRDAHDRFTASNAALIEFWSAAAEGGTQADEAAYFDLLHETFRLESVATSRLRDRNFTLGALGFYWGLNLIDAALFHPPFRVKEGSDGAVQVDLSEKTGPRRALRSLLYPGLGQCYAGQPLRAGAYAVAATAAGVTALVAHLQYKGGLDRIDALERESASLGAGGTAESEARARIAAERQAAVQRSDDDEETRNIAAIVAGAVYAASVIDALLSSPPSPPVEAAGPRIGFVAPPAGGGFGVGVRVPF